MSSGFLEHRPTITKPSDREIRVERGFNAPRELISRWWGRGHKLVVEKYELQPGGHWRFVQHAPDGTHGFEGRFREVEAPVRTVRTFEWDGKPGHVSIETTSLEDSGGGNTRLVTMMLFHTIEERDGMLAAGMEDGLNESYHALDVVLAAMA
jgi:uncharacterized protein YndB with AHSA1/START domain